MIIIVVHLRFADHVTGQQQFLPTWKVMNVPFALE
jgi:hypothetical protein